ncbi:hypothetical protein FBU30_010100 [Linnemannia zychae]|nr:hypothetical protein FBU30_010100 [Linnemannia zychae]
MASNCGPGYHQHHQQQLLLQQQQQGQQQLQLQLQEQQVFDREMTSHSEYEQQQQQQQQPLAATPIYEWVQESTSNQMASALSIDMLLSLGASSTGVGSILSSASSSLTSASLPASSVTGPSMLPLPDATMSDFYSSLQQHYHSLSSIPLATSYSEGYPSSLPLANTTSSLVLSTQQPSMPNTSHIPQQSYYELLMAANPNEPLSQLLSTSASSMSSICFTGAAVSSIPAAAASSSPLLPMDHSSTYTSIDASLPSPPISTEVSGTVVAVGTPAAEQALTSAASIYSLPIFPLEHSMNESQQQTVPLTTKEIMDALSGQFPIQPVITSTATEMSPPIIPSNLPSATPATMAVTTTTAATSITASSDSTNSSDSMDDYSVATEPVSNKDIASVPLCEARTVTTIVEPEVASDWKVVDIASTAVSLSGDMDVSRNITIEARYQQQQQQDDSWDSDVDVLSPPSLVNVHDTDDEGSSPSTSLSSVTSPPAQVDLEMSEMTLTSPPLLPSRPSKSLKRSKSLAAGELTSPDVNTDNGSTRQRRKSRRISRRYQNMSEPISFGARLELTVEADVSKLDLDEHQQYQQDVQEQTQTTIPPKRRRQSDDEVSESPCSSPESSPPSPKTPPPSSVLPLITTHDEDIALHKEIVEGHSTRHELDPSKRFKLKRVEAGVEKEDAGVLTTLLLARTPKRQSSRLLRRTTGQILSDHSASPTNTGVLCAIDAVNHSISSSGHAHPSSPSRGKVSAA